MLEPFRFPQIAKTLYLFVFYAIPDGKPLRSFLELLYFGNLQNAMDLSPLAGDLICTVHSPPGK